MSTNVEASEAFYTSVLGWSIVRGPDRDPSASYFETAEDKAFAHVSSTIMKGTPSHWNSFLRIDDVDASTASAIANGAKQIIPPTDIAPGRFSVICTPSGARMSLFNEIDPSYSHHLETAPGLVHWIELHSKNVDADLNWLKSTFDFEVVEMQMPTGPYYILKSGDVLTGGVMASEPGDENSMWLVWIHVADIEKTVALAESNNGRVLRHLYEVPSLGRMAVIQDPTGGVLGVIAPDAKSHFH